jgi:hypothetical protein
VPGGDTSLVVNKYMYIEIMFYANGYGCRKNPPNLNDGNYHPHSVIKGRDEYSGIECRYYKIKERTKLKWIILIFNQ